MAAVESSTTMSAAAATNTYFGADLAQLSAHPRPRHHYRTAKLLPLEGRESCKVWLCTREPSSRRSRSRSCEPEPLSPEAGQRHRSQRRSSLGSSSSGSLSSRKLKKPMGLQMTDCSSQLPADAQSRQHAIAALATSAPSTPQPPEDGQVEPEPSQCEPKSVTP